MRKHIHFIGKFLTVVLIFGVFFSYAMFQGGFVSWFLFYSFLPLVLYIFLLLIYPISRWEVSRSIAKQVIQAGDEVIVEIKIKRKFAFPIYFLVVEEYFPPSLQRKDLLRKKFNYMNQPNTLVEKRTVKRVVFPLFKRLVRFSYVLKNVPRGEHHLNAIRLKTGDFFGFLKKDYVFSVSDYILAYPSYRKISVREKVNSFDEGASPSYQANMKNTNVVSGVREYMPGDRFSWIDWKTTARKNAVMTKEFEQEKSSNLLLVLDAVDYHGINNLSFEGSIELTASIIEAFRKETAQLTFLSLGGEQLFFSMNQAPGKTDLLINFLARVQPGGTISFPRQLNTQVKQMPGGLITMVIVTCLSLEMKQAIDQLKQKSKRIVIYLVKPMSDITDADRQVINQLSVEGVLVNLITEQQLIKQEFEVNM